MTMSMLKRIGLFLAVLPGLWMAPAARAQEAATSSPPALVSEPTGEAKLVYVIPIHDMIEPALLYVIRRGVKEAEHRKADAIIFEMDTPGGTLDAAGQIVRIIQAVSIPTITFVEKDAYSAGAIIALATDEIYMAPGSVIGDAMPIMMSPFGGVQEMPEDIKEKTVSAVAAKIRSVAESSGHDPELAEAMVRRELEYKIGDEVICASNRLLTLTNQEAERRFGDEERPLLSLGTVASLDDLLELKGLSGATVVNLKVTAAERVARFIAALAPIFLILGLLGIYIEIKTPGFGLPGILGGVCLIIFFWGHHVAGLAGMEDLLLVVTGVVLLLVEVLLIPGFGVTGVAGIILIMVGLLSAMVERLPGTPWYRPDYQDISKAFVLLSLSLTGVFVLAMLLARFMPRLPFFNHLVLQQTAAAGEGFQAATPRSDLLGATGLALSALHPAGPVLINQRKVDVVTRGEYIESGASVRVVEIHGNRIIVEQTT